MKKLFVSPICWIVCGSLLLALPGMTFDQPLPKEEEKTQEHDEPEIFAFHLNGLADQYMILSEYPEAKDSPKNIVIRRLRNMQDVAKDLSTTFSGLSSQLKQRYPFFQPIFLGLERQTQQYLERLKDSVDRLEGNDFPAEGSLEQAFFSVFLRRHFDFDDIRKTIVSQLKSLASTLKEIDTCEGRLLPLD